MLNLQSQQEEILVGEAGGRVTEPVLAQIPLGAPGCAYWRAVGILVWLGAVGVLVPLYGWLAADDPGSSAENLLGHTPAHAVLLGLVASVLLLLTVHHWLRARLMRLFGAPARVLRRGARWFPYSEQLLPRRHALLCLLAPMAVLTSLGLIGMTLRWPWGGMMLIALDWAYFAPDGALAFRLLRERGCAQVHFRPEGVVLYGTSRAPTRPTPARLWLTSLVLGAGWLAPPVFLAAPHLGWDAGWFILLGGSLSFAAVRVHHLRQRAQRQQHQRLGKEADEARQMQRSLLPAAPPSAAGVQLATLFQAAHEVSGDFYLFSSEPPGALRVVVGDVAGKGLPSALTAALAVGFLRAGAETAPDPAALLEAAGKSLRAARDGRTMVAACAAEMETESRRLRWCNAGLPPPALLRGGSVTWLPGTGIPLGSLPQVTYQGQQEQLAAGDLLLFYTDGLVEATSPLGDLFGRERLAAALCRLPAGCAAAEALECLQREVACFIGDAEPYDDITAVALRVR